MNALRIEYDGLADAIITEAAVLKISDSPTPEFHYTDSAARDTGAQFTFISPRVIENLNLQPIGKGKIMGIGGDQITETYKIHLGLPNGKVVYNLVVYCGDIDDYDVLIGMDVISLTDFVISNKQNTVFSFHYPSQGDIELK